MDEKSPLEKAIDLVGNQQKLADALGIKSPSISEWHDRGVPVDRCRAIEALTGGQVTRFDLRPDIFGTLPSVADVS